MQPQSPKLSGDLNPETVLRISCASGWFGFEAAEGYWEFVDVVFPGSKH